MVVLLLSGIFVCGLFLLGLYGFLQSRRSTRLSLAKSLRLAPLPMVLLQKNRLVFANPFALQLFGVKRREDIDTLWMKNFFAPDYQMDGTLSEERWQELFHRIAHAGSMHSTWTIRSADRREKVVWCHFRMVQNRGTRYLLATLLDPADFQGATLLHSQHNESHWQGSATRFTEKVRSLVAELAPQLNFKLTLNLDNEQPHGELRVQTDFVSRLATLIAESVDPTTPLAEQEINLTIEFNHGGHSFLHCFAVRSSHGAQSPFGRRQDHKEFVWESLLTANGATMVVNPWGPRGLVVKVLIPRMKSTSLPSRKSA